jgi:tetratricopeptide (TPR) repeat protein
MLLLIREKIPLFAVSGVFAVLTYCVQQSWGATGLGETLSPGSRLANAAVACTTYIGKMLYPAKLAALYPYPSGGWGYARVIISIAVLAGITVLAVCLARRQRFLAVGWFWYIGTLVPVIGLVQVGRQSMADRYTYIPSIGLSIMAAWGIPELLSGLKYRRQILAASFIAVTAAMVVATRTQITYWKDSITLFSRAAAVTVDNTTMLKNLGNELCSAEDYRKAIDYFNRTIEIDPGDAEAYVCKARALIEMKEFQQAEALLAEALQLRPDSAEAYNWMGVVFSRKSNPKDAIDHYRKAVRLKPDYATAFNNLGMALNDLGKSQEAIEYYRKAIEIKGDYAEAHSNLGLALQSTGNIDEAIRRFRKALLIKPDLSEAQKGLGKALMDSGRIDEAIALYRQVLRRDPSDEAAINNLGAALGRKGDAGRAIELFRKALEIKPDYTDALCNLAVALYKLGRVNEALEKLDRALEIDPDFVRAHKLKYAVTAGRR